VDVAELRERAKQELAEIGPQPNSRHERDVWAEEWHGAAVLLAALADDSRERLRLAATSEFVEAGARRLLLDAAEQCG
jgi:hypothetical protein